MGHSLTYGNCEEIDQPENILFGQNDHPYDHDHPKWLVAISIYFLLLDHNFHVFCAFRRTVGTSPKSIRKIARRIETNPKKINYYSCYESSEAGTCHNFLFSFIILL